MQRRKFQQSYLRAFALVTAMLLAGCSPESDAERTYARNRRQEQLRQDHLRSTLEGVTEETAAVDMVKQWPAPEGEEGTTEPWTVRQLQAVEGDALFPHWRALRRGRGRYDVMFTYTLMNELGTAEKKGFAWHADLVLKVVSGPREMSAAELGRSINARTPRPKRVVRVPLDGTNESPLLLE